jgi:hypothetical protein
MKKVLLLILTFVAFKVSAQNNFPATGNVTIGTAAPGTALLDVNGATRLRNVVEMSNAQFFAINAYNNATAPAGWKYRVAGFASSFVQDAAGNFTFNLGGGPSAASGAINTSVAWRPIYTILNNGNLGIGSISPTEKLELVGNMKFPSGGNYFVSAGGLSSFGESFSTADAYHGSMVKSNVGTAEFVKTATGLGSLITMQANDGIRFQTNLVGASGTPITAALRNAGEVMRITHSGFVGIGTTTPTAKLQITGPAGASGLKFTNLTNTIVNKFLTTDATGNVIMASATPIDSSLRKNISFEGMGTTFGAVQKLFMLNNGNIGIGTTAPAAKLDITTGTAGNSGLKLSNLPNSTANTFLTTNATGNVILATATGGTATPVDSTLRKVIGVQGALGNYGTGQKMQIMTNGFVGVGTSTPASLLDVNGEVAARTLKINPSTGTTSLLNFVNIVSGTAENTYIGSAGAATNIINSSAAGDFVLRTPSRPMLFSTDGGTTTHFKIATNGNVGIGSISPTAPLTISSSNSFIRLEANQNPSFYFTDIVNQYDGAEKFFIKIGDTKSFGNKRLFGVDPYSYVSGYKGIAFVTAAFNPDSASTRMVINNVGNVGIGTTNPQSHLEIGTSRPISFDANAGSVKIKANTGFWAMNYGFKGSAGTDNGGLWAYGSNDSFEKWSIGKLYTDNFFVVKPDGKIGIGNSTPSTNLEITGPANSSGLKFTNLTSATTATASNSKALSVDASGNVILVNAASGGISNLDSITTKKITFSSPSTTHGLKIEDGVGSPNTSHFRFGDGTGWKVHFGQRVVYNTTTQMTGVNGSIMTLDDRGRIGIGTITPAYKLDIINNEAVGGNTVISKFENISGNGGGSGIIKVINNSFNSDFEQNAGGAGPFRFGTYTDLNIVNNTQAGNGPFGNINFVTGNATGSSTVMTIGAGTQKGNIGIGTTAPIEKLDVMGSMLLRNGNNSDSWTKNQVSFGWNNTDNYKHSIRTRHNSLGLSGNSIDFYTWQFGVDATTASPTKHIMSLSGEGNVGIGTPSPAYKLDIAGSGLVRQRIVSSNDQANITLQGTIGQLENLVGDFFVTNSSTSGSMIFRTNGAQERMKIMPNGDIGIGTSTPTAIFGKTVHINDPLGASLILTNSTVSSYLSASTLYGGSLAMVTSNSTPISFHTNSVERMRINASGQVIIGTSLSTPLLAEYELAVGGSMIAEKVKVRKQSAGWPDFVFKKDYKLMTLPEIEAFVNKNSHLPEIPSAAEIEKDGQDLGEMNRLLLKKVEELTLHLIEQNKKLTEVVKTSEQQQKEIEILKKKN